MRRMAILYAMIASLSCVQCVIPRNPVGFVEVVKRRLNPTRVIADFFAAFLRRVMLPRLSQAGR